MRDNLATSDRTAEQLRNQYETEKGLADRLRNASREDRLKLYPEVYDELYRKVPDHPMLTRKVTVEERATQVQRQMHYLSKFLRPDMTVLEVGAGDCSLSFSIAERVGKVYGLEVSEVISAQARKPENFELIICNGFDIPLASASVDLVYSNNVIEHLHPDDVVEQLTSIFRVLKPGGLYFCRTPHKLQGPTDISCLFDDEPTCLHLKEYTYSELERVFGRVGFGNLFAYISKGGAYRQTPMRLVRLLEVMAGAAFGRLPYKRRQAWLGVKPFTVFGQGVSIAGRKT